MLGSTLFGGLSGSAVADETALGGMLIPWQVKAGCPPAFCGATIAAAATIDISALGPADPLFARLPCFDWRLFLAGILPGLLLAGGFLAVCNISARLREFPYEKTPVAWGAIGLCTPPVGAILFIGSMLSRSGIGQVVKELLPFYVVGLLVLA